MFVVYGVVAEMGREMALMSTTDEDLARMEAETLRGYGACRVETLTSPDAIDEAEREIAELNEKGL